MDGALTKSPSERGILITGCAGFIGFHLAKRLLDLNYRIVGFDNLNDYYDVVLKHKRLELMQDYNNFSFIRGDIAVKKQLEELFEGHRPQIIVHLAAQAGVRYSIENPEAYIQSNIIGFFNILEACRRYPVEHMIYASSSSVYGANKKVPFSTEDIVDKPVSLYAATKKSNELMAYTYSHLYKIPATGLRFFTVYGPWGRPDMAYYSFTRDILKGSPIKVFNHGDLYRDFTYIDDIVTGIVSVMGRQPEQDENGTRHKVYNIGNNKPEKLMDFITTLERCLGQPAIKEYLPMQAGDVYQTYADVTELMNDFDFKPDTPISVGLKNFVDWYRDYYRI